MDTIESRTFAARLAQLLRNEQHAMADFLVALADFARRRRWVALGFSGLFPFLHGELGLSKAAAFFRKTAAELIQRYPELVEPLRDGRICLTTLGSLAKVITPENRTRGIRADASPGNHVPAHEAELRSTDATVLRWPSTVPASPRPLCPEPRWPSGARERGRSPHVRHTEGYERQWR